MQESRNLEQLVAAAAYFGGNPGDPVKGLEHAHRIQIMMCDMLEQIADSIPGAIDHGLCAQLAEQLCPVLKSVHRFEEKALFPMLGDKEAGTIERLKHEHFDDECFAEELSEVLSNLGRRKKPENPEALGYMLRAFFEAMRRHVAFESDHLKLLVR